jgi:hypothetical protein
MRCVDCLAFSFAPNLYVIGGTLVCGLLVERPPPNGATRAIETVQHWRGALIANDVGAMLFARVLVCVHGGCSLLAV